MIYQLFKHAAVYGFATMLHSAAGFLLLPLYTKYLTVSEYGILEFFIVSITIIVSIIPLGIGSALFKYYSYDGLSETSKTQNDKLISTAFYFVILISLISITLLFVNSKNISAILFNDIKYTTLIHITLGISLAEIFFIIPTSCFRIDNNSLLLSIINGIKFLFQISLTILIVVALNQKVEGVLSVRALTSASFGLLFIFLIRKKLKPVFSFPIIKELLSYSIFLVPVSVGIMILMMSSRYFILGFLDPEQLGIYSVAYRISGLILLIVMGFQMAWPSMMFRIKDLTNAKEYFTRIQIYFFIIFIFFVLSMTFFSQELIFILSNQQYSEAAKLIPILSFGFFFYGIFYAGSIGINIYKKTYYQSIAMGISSLLNLLLNFILTPLMGITGTAIAFCVSFIILGVLAFIFSQRIYFIPIEWHRILKSLTIVIVLICVYYWKLYDMALSHFFLKGFILVIVFPGSLFLFGIITEEEKKFLTSLINNLKNKLSVK